MVLLSYYGLAATKLYAILYVEKFSWGHKPAPFPMFFLFCVLQWLWNCCSFSKFQAEKDELRDEKQKLKLEKESLEHQMKLMTSTPAYMPHPTLMPAPFPQAPLAPFHPQAQAAGQKLMMPFVGYPGYPMWQFMPPSEVDTSKDSEACPPVA